MKISGFSMVRNATKLYYPIKEAIESILPICDEFIVAVGEGDSDDKTKERIESIDSDKVKVIDTVWKEKHFENGQVNAIQTNIALDECSGDWCFYLQADEVIHEKYLPIIKDRCREFLNDDEVEGLVFDYKHFWGDYDHYQISHGWYKREVRVIKNNCGIRSNNSAQGFKKKNGEKPRVAHAKAEVYHYGWVRPPYLMQSKKKALDTVHWGKEEAKEFYKTKPDEFDYGPLDQLPVYNGTHPTVMEDWIAKMNWEDKLQYSGKPDPRREPHKHERTKTKILTAIEQWLERKFGGKVYLSAHRNYKLLGEK